MKQNSTIFLIELFFFVLTLLLGVIVSSNIAKIINIAEAGSSIDYFNQEVISPIAFIGYFILATILVFLVSKNEKLKKIRIAFFKISFLFSVAIGSIIALSTMLDSFLAFLISLILVLVWQKKPIILLHNLLICLSIAGIGSFIGYSFSSFIIISFLLLFSIYDFVAVYKTKHMVKMATEMIKTRAILGLIIPLTFNGLLDDLEKKKKKEFMVLGGGDLAFPLFLVSSVFLDKGFLSALIMILFASLGLFFSFYFFIAQKTKKPIPALPPIAIFTILGFLIVFILEKI